MKLRYRNIIAVHLMALILFSTIGFNIYTTFCYGCEEEHTSVVFTDTENVACSCCDQNTPAQNCCSNTKTDHKEEHPITSKLVQLKVESPEAKSKYLASQPPVVLLYFIAVFLAFDEIFESINSTYQPVPLIKTGKSLLTFICVFRN